MDQPSPRYRIFISSTTADLGDYRQATARTIEQLGHEPVMMELTMAHPESAVQHSRKTIASCDVMISLLGHRYGFIPQDINPNQYSFVEIELRYAWEIGKPTLVFMVDEDTPWPPQFIERDPKLFQQVNALRKEALGRVRVGFFRSQAELERQVRAAIGGLNIDTFRRPDVLQAQIDIPTSVDPFELAWRLVVDFKAEPALLAHMDPSALLQATQQWARESRPNEPFDGTELFDGAQAHLRDKQAAVGPSPLWLAWKRSTALKPQPARNARNRA